MFWAFENGFLIFFALFSVNKLKMFLGEARESIQDCVNPRLDIESILENGFETTLRSKAYVLLNLWKRQFSDFCTFLSHEVETAWMNVKARQSVQKSLNQKLVMVSSSENGFEATGKTWMLWAFENGILGYLQISQWQSRNHSTESEKRHQNYLNWNLVIRSFLQNRFQATLGSKTNVLSVWKGIFMFFWKFLSEEAETIFWESEAKVSKLFKSKFGHRKILRKWFSCYLEFKDECSEVWKGHF